MLNKSSEQAEAILFLRPNGEVVREMLFSEFEAILDGVVPMLDMADESVECVYLRINCRLHVTAVVFFLLGFDSIGNADPRWNVPLQQLAETSGKGPDMGSGSVRLACASQCCIPWQQKNLWDPNLTSGSNSFSLIKKRIQKNTLGLVFAEEEGSPSKEPAIPSGLNEATFNQLQQRQKEELKHLERRLQKEHRLQQASLKNQHKLQLMELKQQHQKRLESYREQMQSLKQQLLQSDQRNQSLKQTIDGQADKMVGLREYFEHKLNEARHGEAAELQGLKQYYELETSSLVAAKTKELKEMLEMREMELMYRNEAEINLREEVASLRQKNQSLMQNSGDQLLQKVASAGVNFVAYHAATGHMTIPLNEMGEYLGDPDAYIAKQCGVHVDHYRHWLDHHHTPICQALDAHGEVCGRPLEQVASPSDFHLGESDRCRHHLESAATIFAVVNR